MSGPADNKANAHPSPEGDAVPTSANDKLEDSERENMYRMVFEKSPLGLIWLDAKLKFVSANPMFCEMLGYTEAELKTMSVADLTVPEDKIRSVEAAEATLNVSKEIRRFEKRYLKKNGEIIWVQVSSRALTSPTTGEQNLFSIIEDVTDLRQIEYDLKVAEARRKQSEAYMNVILNSIQQGVWGLNTNGEFTFINEMALKLLGYDRAEDLIGEKAHALVHHKRPDGSAYPASECPMYASFRDGTVSHVTTEVLWRRDGTSFPIAYYCAPIFNSAQKCIGSVVSFEDLTAQRELERQLESERINAIQNSKLASLGVMAGGVAHEINNPLAIIILKTDLAIRRIAAGSIDSERITADLSMIRKTAERIAKIVSGLRTFSRMGDADPMAAVNVQSVIEETLAFCTERFKTLGVELSVVCPDDIAIECRANEISQILMNLINNAADAVQSLKAKWVRVEAEATADRVKIKVTDSGAGIPSQVLEKLMVPFFTTKEVGKGTGLGLSISRKLAQNHNGDLSFDGSNGHTCFVLDLPRYQTTTENNPAKAS